LSNQLRINYASSHDGYTPYRLKASWMSATLIIPAPLKSNNQKQSVKLKSGL